MLLRRNGPPSSSTERADACGGPRSRAGERCESRNGGCGFYAHCRWTPPLWPGGRRRPARPPTCGCVVSCAFSDDRPRGSARAAESAFSTSVLISAVRCLLTYVVFPIVGPIVGIAGGVGPVVGLVVGAVSSVAIVASMRRFFRADHRWRWRYAAVGGTILVFLFVQAVLDIAHLAG